MLPLCRDPFTGEDDDDEEKEPRKLLLLLLLYVYAMGLGDIPSLSSSCYFSAAVAGAAGAARG